jgi:deoxycytidylate deaminase
MMCKKHHVTAIIFDKRGRPLSIGQNSYSKSIRLQRKHANLVGMPEKAMTHAEIHAIAKCRSLDKAHTIKVFRYNKSGAPANAMPCKVCMSAIAEANIRNIEWTTDLES